jgi:predicted O-methyltransferase YrrM
MTPDRWRFTNAYSREVFGEQDQHLAGLMAEALDAGLPDIAISADVGRLLLMITSMTRGRLAIEVGTLGGYSGIWLARGLRPDGRLITIELEPRHAEFARVQFERAGVADRVDQRLGPALDVLPALAAELEPGSVDVIFLDALKTEYPAYWEIVRPLIAPGGVILADNALGSSEWWIDVPNHESRQAADRFNRLVADDPEFDAVVIPLRQGVLFGRRC